MTKDTKIRYVIGGCCYETVVVCSKTVVDPQITIQAQHKLTEKH